MRNTWLLIYMTGRARPSILGFKYSHSSASGLKIPTLVSDNYHIENTINLTVRIYSIFAVVRSLEADSEICTSQHTVEMVLPIWRVRLLNLELAVSIHVVLAVKNFEGPDGRIRHHHVLTPETCQATTRAALLSASCPSGLHLHYQRLWIFQSVMEASDTAPSVTETDVLLKALRQELKQWETSFFATNKRKAERQDIKEHPEIGTLVIGYLHPLAKEINNSKSRDTKNTTTCVIHLLNLPEPKQPHPRRSAIILHPRTRLTQHSPPTST